MSGVTSSMIVGPTKAPSGLVPEGGEGVTVAWLEWFEPRMILPLSLSYDHRVIDGASAARFAAYLAQVLADMRRVLL